MTPYSAAAGGSFSSRASSRSTALRASSGRFFASICSRSSASSACCSSPSPSSSWIAFSCWRRKNSRWPLSISDWTCDWIFEPSSTTSSSRLRIIEDLPQPHGDVGLFEQALLLLGLEAQRRGDEVRERARVVHVRGGELELGREVGDERDQPSELVLDVAGERLELGALLEILRHLAELADEVRLVLHRALEADPPDPLDEDAQRAVGDADHLVHDRGGPDLVEVVPAGLLCVLVADRDEREQPLAGGHVVDELDRALLADRERRDRLREDDGLLQRQDRQDRRDLDVALLELLFEAELAHFRPPTTIATRVCFGGVATIGSSIVSSPCS